MSFKSLDLSEIRKVLESGNFAELLDARENECLEAKPPSAFDMTAGHPTDIKLANYAASFANKWGGYVICGLTTARPENTPHDVVTEINSFKREEFYNSGEIIDRILRSTYPAIRVDVQWYPDSASEGMGLGVIYIPPQEEAKKFFHVRIRSLDGALLKHELFGVPIRADGFTDWMKVDDLYTRSKVGPNRLREVYDGLSNQIRELAASIRSSGTSIDELQNKIDQLP
jgi:hypothetical protein